MHNIKKIKQLFSKHPANRKSQNKLYSKTRKKFISLTSSIDCLLAYDELNTYFTLLSSPSSSSSLRKFISFY